MADPVTCRSWLALVACASLLLVGACASAGNASTAGHPHPPASQIVAPVSAMKLEGALLTQFGLAKRIAPAPSAPAAVVLTPRSQNDAQAKRYGAADFPVRNPQCRTWVAGLWGTAVHTTGLGISNEAALASLYGEYANVDRGAHSLSAVPLMDISEIVLEVPTGATATQLEAGPVPASCQHTQLWSQNATGQPYGWYPGHIQPLPAPGVGQDSRAELDQAYIGTPFLHQDWRAIFRLNNFAIQVAAIMWPGVPHPATVLNQLAQAAYTKARGALSA